MKFLCAFPNLYIYALRKFAGISRKGYFQYIVCPTCHSLYNPKVEKMTESPIGAMWKCPLIAPLFAEHPFQSKRAPCGTKLMRKVKCAGNSNIFQPKLTYCYLSLKNSLAS